MAAKAAAAKPRQSQARLVKKTTGPNNGQQGTSSPAAAGGAGNQILPATLASHIEGDLASQASATPASKSKSSGGSPASSPAQSGTAAAGTASPGLAPILASSPQPQLLAGLRVGVPTQEDLNSLRADLQKLQQQTDHTWELYQGQSSQALREAHLANEALTATLDLKLAQFAAELSSLRTTIPILATQAVRDELDRMRRDIVQESVSLSLEGAKEMLRSAAAPGSSSSSTWFPPSSPFLTANNGSIAAAAAAAATIQQPCGGGDAFHELDQLRLRAERAELELKATRSELELKVVKPELQLKALRAEQELGAALQSPQRVRPGGMTEQHHHSQTDGVSEFDEWDDELMPAGALPSSGPMIVLDRYQVQREDIIGQGGFSVVRRGVDTLTGQAVAVKTYWDQEEGRQEDWILEKFNHEVSIFQKLHAKEDLKANILKQKKSQRGSGRGSWFVPEAVSETDGLEVFSAIPDASELFVRLLDFSTDSQGAPGPREGDNGICYIVLELAEYTLHEYLETRGKSGLYLDKIEVHRLFRQLANMILVLHSKNFVHIDLKPLNIMHFPSGHWKLIDMDGMVWPGSATACDVCYTPYYVAPEIAVQFADQQEEVDTSRLLDVWSLGMCVCELVTMSPVLEAAYNQLYELHQDSTVFLHWLADPSAKIEIPRRLRTLDPLLADLTERMLQKDPRDRASMVEVVAHPYFSSGSIGPFLNEPLYDGAAVKPYMFDLFTRSAKRAGDMGTSSSCNTLHTADTGHDTGPAHPKHDKRQVRQPAQTMRKRVSNVRACDVQSTEATARALSPIVEGASPSL